MWTPKGCRAPKAKECPQVDVSSDGQIDDD